ncbi:hypothetical protein ASG99_12425 [Bacillus sp. Soil768D1]|nr:hypothetical protein ASG99_12425 [Bacillus sp. Soil768D1]
MAVLNVLDFNNVNLNYLSNTLPSIKENEVEREQIIKNIEETFSVTNKMIMIEGEHESGKTTLLAQFARKHKKNCISFFIGEDYWHSNATYFLSELCVQMTAISSDGLKNRMANYNIEDFQEYELLQLFQRLYSDLCRQARQNNNTFYIVIDGLDKIDNNVSVDNIMKYLPKGDPEGVYVLLSSLREIDYDFDYFPMQMQFFSRLETESILKDYLSIEEISNVYSACDGMPGYISEILRQLKDGKIKTEILNSLPSSFKVLLEKTWLQYDHKDKNFIRFLSLMTYAPEALSKEDIVKILDLPDYLLSSYLEQLSFVDEKNNTLILLGAYKTFFVEKLKNNKTDVLQDIIKYYENNNSNTPSSMIYLPELYQEKQEYNSLVSLIDIKNINNVIQSTQKISIVRKNLRILSTMAHNHSDWEKLSWAVLTESVFTELATTPPAVEGQIKALLSLNLYKDALKLTYSCALPEDRLILLSHICKYMKKNNIEISTDIIISIEESINLIDNTVELSDQLVDKLIDICSNIFPINASLSLKLIKRIAKKTGENVESEKLMDYLLIRLLVRVDKADEDINQIKEQIGNDDLQDFIRVAADFIDEEDIEELLERIKLINDTSAKLFYLQNWCSKNEKSKVSHIVVEHALNIITESIEYSPTQRHLRQFAKPLQFSVDIDKTKELVSRIENLQSTILKKPVEEYARLELSLAKTEKRWSEELAVERFYSVYMFLDELQDYDSKCLVLIHLLDSLNDILNKDEKLFKELRDQLIMDYNRLMTTSADHFSISKKIIFLLAKIDKELALTFANKINTQHRRYMGYAEIIRSHINQNIIDFNFLEFVLNQIKEKPFKDWVIVHILNEFSKLNVDAPEDIKNKYFGSIKTIDSVDGKALGFSYYINWIFDNTDKCNLAFKELKANLLKITDINKLKNLAFKIVQILSETNIEHAEVLYQMIINDYQTNNLFDSRLNSLFSQMVELLIRMTPDTLKSDDYKFKLKLIKNTIYSIPSPYQQCVLLSSLALRCAVNGEQEILREIAEKYLDVIENCSEDIDTFNKIIIDTAPLLFEYESNLFFEKIQNVNSSEYRDLAIINVIKYIISKRPIEDPIDLSTIQKKIYFPEASKICTLIGTLETDSNIYSMISILVDALVEPNANNKYASRLREKQLLNITEQLIKIINDKLPDKSNIKHNGYKIASFGCLTKLRDTASSRANKRWDSIFPTRDELKKSANEISNTSDKVFVLASLGKSTYFVDNELGITLIKEAENNLAYLNNPLDRVERYELVAESYQKASNSKAAKFILEQAIISARACSHEQGRDQMLGGLIDLAHSIDPNLAQSYASNIDSKESLANLSERLTTLNLHSDPKKIQSYKKEQTDRILHDFFSKVLKTLCSSRGTIQHNEVIGQSISYAIGQSFETILLGVSWFVENSIASNKHRSESELGELFMGVFQLLELIRNVEVTMYDSASTAQVDNFYKVLTETNIHTFDLNEQEEAKKIIINWISQNANEYLKIHDPYFNEEMLELIKHTGIDARVFIYGSSKTSDMEELPKRYKAYWNSICDNVPPETHFHLFSTKSGTTPLHDRFLIGEKSGLNLGTSLNGFGNKFSTIRFLDLNEKEKIERDIILPLISMPPTHFKEEKLVMKMFSLNN